VIDPTLSQQWKDLESHSSLLKERTLKDLIFEDSTRAENLSFEIDDLFIDFSKQMITNETIDLLGALAYERGLSEKIDALFSGEIVNISENRPALHTALRFSTGPSEDVNSAIRDALSKASEFSSAIRTGKWVGATGKPITSVVNIGIGGSHLGPLMVSAALRPYAEENITCSFVSNIDPIAIDYQLNSLEPESTLFIINSKSFTTSETITNAEAALQWAQNALGSENDLLKKHFVAVTANPEAAERLGVLKQNIFPIWDWVGGRFSVCSSVSLAAMIAIGAENFQKLLEGCHSIDEHFRSTELSKNVPALMGMIGIWNRNFLGYGNHAVIPYSADLTHFPSYLQQLEMESNGKKIRQDGDRVSTQTSPVILGGAGTDAQHSFFQLLHQGTTIIPTDFITFCKPSLPAGNLSEEVVLKQHEILVANCFAQSKALAIGSDSEPESFLSDGNRPSTTILGNRLDPFALGQLVALYEHKVFTMGVLWQINSFDQWGVQLGKQLAEIITKSLTETRGHFDHDSSTTALLDRYQKSRET
jgi:glucose-6-phosphate isomerase